MRVPTEEKGSLGQSVGGQNCLESQLCGCGMAEMWDEKAQGDPFGLPCQEMPVFNIKIGR